MVIQLDFTSDPNRPRLFFTDEEGENDNTAYEKVGVNRDEEILRLRKQYEKSQSRKTSFAEAGQQVEENEQMSTWAGEQLQQLQTQDTNQTASNPDELQNEYPGILSTAVGETFRGVYSAFTDTGATIYDFVDNVLDTVDNATGNYFKRTDPGVGDTWVRRMVEQSDAGLALQPRTGYGRFLRDFGGGTMRIIAALGVVKVAGAGLLANPTVAGGLGSIPGVTSTLNWLAGSGFWASATREAGVGALGGFLADFTDAEAGNLADFGGALTTLAGKHLPWSSKVLEPINNSILKPLGDDEDAGFWSRQFKNAAVNSFLGIPIDFGLEFAGDFIRKFRGTEVEAVANKGGISNDLEKTKSIFPSNLTDDDVSALMNERGPVEYEKAATKVAENFSTYTPEQQEALKGLLDDISLEMEATATKVVEHEQAVQNIRGEQPATPDPLESDGPDPILENIRAYEEAAADGLVPDVTAPTPEATAAPETAPIGPEKAAEMQQILDETVTEPMPSEGVKTPKSVQKLTDTITRIKSFFQQSSENDKLTELQQDVDKLEEQVKNAPKKKKQNIKDLNKQLKKDIAALKRQVKKQGQTNQKVEQQLLAAEQLALAMEYRQRRSFGTPTEAPDGFIPMKRAVRSYQQTRYSRVPDPWNMEGPEISPSPTIQDTLERQAAEVQNVVGYLNAALSNKPFEPVEFVPNKTPFFDPGYLRFSQKPSRPLNIDSTPGGSIVPTGTSDLVAPEPDFIEGEFTEETGLPSLPGGSIGQRSLPAGADVEPLNLRPTINLEAKTPDNRPKTVVKLDKDGNPIFEDETSIYDIDEDKVDFEYEQDDNQLRKGLQGLMNIFNEERFINRDLGVFSLNEERQFLGMLGIDYDEANAALITDVTMAAKDLYINREIITKESLERVIIERYRRLPQLQSSSIAEDLLRARGEEVAPTEKFDAKTWAEESSDEPSFIRDEEPQPKSRFGKIIDILEETDADLKAAKEDAVRIQENLQKVKEEASDPIGDQLRELELQIEKNEAEIEQVLQRQRDIPSTGEGLKGQSVQRLVDILSIRNSGYEEIDWESMYGRYIDNLARAIARDTTALIDPPSVRSLGVTDFEDQYELLSNKATYYAYRRVREVYDDSIELFATFIFDEGTSNKAAVSGLESGLADQLSLANIRPLVEETENLKRQMAELMAMRQDPAGNKVLRDLDKVEKKIETNQQEIDELDELFPEEPVDPEAAVEPEDEMADMFMEEADEFDDEIPDDLKVSSETEETAVEPGTEVDFKALTNDPEYGNIFGSAGIWKKIENAETPEEAFEIVEEKVMRETYVSPDGRLTEMADVDFLNELRSSPEGVLVEESRSKNAGSRQGFSNLGEEYNKAVKSLTDKVREHVLERTRQALGLEQPEAALSLTDEQVLRLGGYEPDVGQDRPEVREALIKELRREFETQMAEDPEFRANVEQELGLGSTTEAPATEAPPVTETASETEQAILDEVLSEDPEIKRLVEETDVGEALLQKARAEVATEEFSRRQFAYGMMPEGPAKEAELQALIALREEMNQGLDGDEIKGLVEAFRENPKAVVDLMPEYERKALLENLKDVDKTLETITLEELKIESDGINTIEDRLVSQIAAKLKQQAEAKNLADTPRALRPEVPEYSVDKDKVVNSFPKELRRFFKGKNTTRANDVRRNIQAWLENQEEDKLVELAKKYEATPRGWKDGKEADLSLEEASKRELESAILLKMFKKVGGLGTIQNLSSLLTEEELAKGLNGLLTQPVESQVREFLERTGMSFQEFSEYGLAFKEMGWNRNAKLMVEGTRLKYEQMLNGEAPAPAPQAAAPAPKVEQPEPVAEAQDFSELEKMKKGELVDKAVELKLYKNKTAAKKIKKADLLEAIKDSMASENSLKTKIASIKEKEVLDKLVNDVVENLIDAGEIERQLADLNLTDGDLTKLIAQRRDAISESARTQYNAILDRAEELGIDPKTMSMARVIRSLAADSSDKWRSLSSKMQFQELNPTQQKYMKDFMEGKLDEDGLLTELTGEKNYLNIAKVTSDTDYQRIIQGFLDVFDRFVPKWTVPEAIFKTQKAYEYWMELTPKDQAKYVANLRNYKNAAILPLFHKKIIQHTTATMLELGTQLENLTPGTKSAAEVEDLLAVHTANLITFFESNFKGQTSSAQYLRFSQLSNESDEALAEMAARYLPGDPKVKAEMPDNIWKKKIEEARKDLATPQGRERMKKLVVDLKTSNGDPKKVIDAAAAYNQGFTLKKSMNLIDQIRIGGLLSGLGTQTAQLVGNTFMTGYVPFTRTIGTGLNYALTKVGIKPGDAPTAAKDLKEALSMYSGLVMYAHDGLKAFNAAWKVGDSIFDPRTTRAREDMFGPNLMNGDFGWMTGFARAASVGQRLMVSTDEMFKQMNYRAHARSKVLRKAMDKVDQGVLKPELVQPWVEKNVNRLIGIDPRTGQRGLALDPDSKEYAEFITFSKEIKSDNSFWRERAQKVAQSVRRFPVIGKMFVPFVTSPLNMLGYAFRHIPGLAAFSKEYRMDFLGQNGPQKQAQAYGELSLGMLTIFAGADLASKGIIVGDVPSDPKNRQAFYNEGKIPYSIKFGGKYISMAKLEPYGTLLSMMANFQNTLANGSDSTAMEAMSVYLATMLNVAKDKSYFTGLAELIELANDFSDLREDEGTITAGSTATSRVLGRQAASYLPLGSALRNVRMTVDPNLREPEAVTLGAAALDEFKNKVPGLSQTLPPKINMFTGEPVKYEGGLIGAAFPYSSYQGDKVFDTLATFSQGYVNPSQSINGNPLSEQQYAEYLTAIGTIELGGRTLYQSLEALFDNEEFDNVAPELLPFLSASYQNDVADNDPRIQAIRNITQNYQDFARRNMMTKYPELQQKPTDGSIEQLQKALGGL